MNINHEQLHEELPSYSDSDVKTESVSEPTVTEKRTRPTAKKSAVAKKVLSKKPIRSNELPDTNSSSGDEVHIQQTTKSNVKKSSKSLQTSGTIENEGVTKPASKPERTKKSSKETATQSDISKQDEKSATASKKSVKKPSATKQSKGATAESPSIEELTAFITSLKSSSKSTISHDDDDFDNDEDFSNDPNLSEGDDGKQGGRAGDDELVQQADGRPVSRREQRRLQWLEKRRQLIELKKQERLTKKLQRTDVPNDGGSEDITPISSGTGSAKTPTQAVQAKGNRTGQPQPTQAPAQKENLKTPPNKISKPQNQQELAQRGDPRPTVGKITQKGQQSGTNPIVQSEQGRISDTQQKQHTPQSQSHNQAKPQSRQGSAPTNSQKQNNTPQTVQQEQKSSPQPTKQVEAKAVRPKPTGKQEQTSRSKPQEVTDAPQPQKTETTKQDVKKDSGKQSSKKGKQSTRAPHQDKIDLADEQQVQTKLPPKRFYMPKRLANVPLVSDEVHAIIERVENFMVNELLVDDGASILIAVSGGVDSVALLDILSIISYERGYLLNVVHVNHQLRGDDSKRDERHVRALAERYHVGCHSTSVNVKDFANRHSLSIEEASRELRYKFFRQTSGTVRAGYCATAHHADDSAETLLMNLFRGTGLTGLAGIPPRRLLMKKTTLVRPLLCLGKNEILEYAKLRNLEWYDDDTNTIATFTRNKVRHDLIPKIKEEFNPNIIASLSRTASLLRRADGFIDSLIDSTYSDITVEADNKISIDVHKFSVLHEFLQGELAERAVAWLTTGKPVSLSAIDRIISLTDKEPGTKETLYQNVIALRERDAIVLMYENHVQEIYLSIYKLGVFHIGRYTITLDEVTRNEVRIGESKNVEYVDYDKLPYRLTLRTWHPGDTFHPIGMKGHSKVSDYLTNAKVENSERSNTVVVTTTTDIVWLVGHRLSDDFKLTNETRRIIRMSVVEEKEELTDTSKS
jgi:tRNA(Ile)-lysidine synthase